MASKVIVDAASAASKSLASDLYVEAKEWLKRLDPGDTKLDDYRNGVFDSLGHIQTLGMASTRSLSQVYIALRVYSQLRKAQSRQASAALNSTNVAMAAAVRKFERARHRLNIDKAIRELGYTQKLDDERIQHRKDIDKAINELGYTVGLEEGDAIEDCEVTVDDELTLLPSKTMELGSKVESPTAQQPPRVVHGSDAIRMVQKYRRLIILGQPGSGKTTFLKYLALAHSGFVRAPAGTMPLLPIFIPLRELRRVSEPKPTGG
jgi:ATPase subunit of ABC transporter with duplicated ATPase domains